MINFTGLQREELRALALGSTDPRIILAARDEIVRRELDYETDTRTGRRRMGSDLGTPQDE
jgi:hypothetical protein